MYFSAKHIDVKLNQDYADFNDNSLIICDGIGEFKDSEKVAKLVVEQFIGKEYSKLSDLIADNELVKFKNENIIGGTTFISAVKKNSLDKIQIEYLGNGGVVHLYGDFSTNVNSDEPYRYGEIMIPHISPSGALTKHISHNSKKLELTPSSIEINLNYMKGDIIILYSDGISSLEDKVILKDNNNRFWRNENPAIQLILRELDSFLKSSHNHESFQEEVIKFNQEILEKLNIENYLEDDASLGIIITESTLNHYNAKS